MHFLTLKVHDTAPDAVGGDEEESYFIADDAETVSSGTDEDDEEEYNMFEATKPIQAMRNGGGNQNDGQGGLMDAEENGPNECSGLNRSEAEPEVNGFGPRQEFPSSENVQNAFECAGNSEFRAEPFVANEDVLELFGGNGDGKDQSDMELEGDSESGDGGGPLGKI